MKNTRNLGLVFFFFLNAGLKKQIEICERKKQKADDYFDVNY